MHALMVVSSKHGGTAELGAVIVEELSRLGVETSVVEPTQVTVLPDDAAIILGGAIYAQAWLPVLSDFVHRHQAELRQRFVFVFASGPWCSRAEEVPLPEKIAALAELVDARLARQFGGRIDSAKLGTVERSVMRMRGVIDGDYRRLDDARAWAREIATEMRQLAAVPPR